MVWLFDIIVLLAGFIDVILGGILLYETFAAVDIFIFKKIANANYISNFEDIKKYLELNAQKDDIILLQGAGDIYKIGEEMVKK